MLKFSIIIPVKAINSYIKESIPHLLNLDYPKDKYEILILPNSRPNYIPKYLQDSRIKIISTGKVSPAVKRDMGSDKAEGEVLAFIDDDSYPREDWLETADDVLNQLPSSYAAINGPAITPKDATLREDMSGAFFSSIFGGGAPHRCRSARDSFVVDDAPSVNLLVKRKAFIEVGGFGSEYWPGEDSLFCQKLKDNRYRIWYQNDFVIYHHRRKTIMGHLKQVAGYGKHRGNFFRKGIGCSRKFLYLVPSLFLIWNLIGLFIWPFFVATLLIYFVLLILSLSESREMDIILLFPTVALTYVSHLTYGLYFIKGFFIKDVRSKLR